ncbi:MAG: serine hydroxymethyltransferase [Candidatus Phytoplasma stylosanthis]|uniref:serine hydroxymethyltransferase n=1 Tax=Candidatus Phytoplasma stylosanthis TaxID=2798314 RepID=UPI00293A4234|nr:serine hydroxymethyltransferase [Candidatus Phytoplasma stylosanthis]MDV3167983.1 serine hydroxymethyltransferase [Candidatus Phytoplasma stylosanthis]MDV3170784.1 serine hydroxymethyltransferase [Candidatus Phytoplasma stylosanthis]MDV3174202.1 serine hydroxymethyltransferase [Candidatus Phytoplasma stylosanthis]MDV3202727.1 serine hydroxymethyltransferase [Candidatus Phytoplasma stylosanthis]
MNYSASGNEIFKIIEKEKKRQKEHLELIASENFVSKFVLKAQGSILTNKYAEGYPNKRYYNGCENVDKIEKIAIEKAKELFNVRFANVQPHSGSQANAAVFQALLKPNDSILGMSLNDGGHLTHGFNLNFSGKFFLAHSYGVEKETEMIDYKKVREIAKEVKPKLIIAGTSAYSRIINFQEFRKIADEVNAYLMIDMAHIAGLVACGLHPCPFSAGADVVTTTTHKTLRGPRGGLILSNNEEIMKKVNKGVFPGIQGGPLMHIIAAKAVAFEEALKKEFKVYQKKVIKNAFSLADSLKKLGYRLISGTTENHLVLVDLKYKHPHLNGKIASEVLQKAKIIVNKNVIPFDKEKPFYTSGIRLGTPALTTRGFEEKEFIKIAKLIDKVLNHYKDKKIIKEVSKEVLFLTKKFPIYKN